MCNKIVAVTIVIGYNIFEKGGVAMPEMKRAIKDSVFTYLFKQPEYTRLLYLALHPEDEDVTEQDCKLITLENVISTGIYNDLGFQVRDRLFLLVEAQSTFSINIVLRMLLYLAATYKEYVEENKLDLYSGKAVRIPRPELYVVYTGEREDIPEMLSLSELYEGAGDAEIHVKVLRDEKSGDILAQYVRFCKIVDINRRLHGSTQKALDEAFHQCMEENILTSFLASRKKEVTDIMVTLFDYDTIQEIHDFNVARDAEKRGEQRGEQRGKQKGEEDRDRLYSELIKRLVPLGRIDDVLAATSDKSKLSDLAKEFGFQI